MFRVLRAGAVGKPTAATPLAVDQAGLRPGGVFGNQFRAGVLVGSVKGDKVTALVGERSAAVPLVVTQLFAGRVRVFGASVTRVNSVRFPASFRAVARVASPGCEILCYGILRVTQGAGLVNLGHGAIIFVPSGCVVRFCVK